MFPYPEFLEVDLAIGVRTMASAAVPPNNMIPGSLFCHSFSSPFRVEPRYRHFEIQSPAPLLESLEYSLTAPTLPCCRSAQLIPFLPLVAARNEFPLSGPAEIPAVSHLPVSGLPP